MTLFIAIALLVCIVGGLVWVISYPNPKWSYLGLVAFGCGLLVTLFAVTSPRDPFELRGSDTHQRK